MWASSNTDGGRGSGNFYHCGSRFKNGPLSSLLDHATHVRLYIRRAQIFEIYEGKKGINQASQGAVVAQSGGVPAVACTRFRIVVLVFPPT